MLFTQTSEKLRALRLEGMAQALEEQRHQNDIVSLGFEDRLVLLVERQWLWKENRGLAIRLKNAQLKISASLEDLDYRSSRGLKRAQIDQLRASHWVKEHRNCLITGPTGSGKTYLACAVGAQACREGYSTLYFYAPKFFRVLETARADGSLLPLLKKLARAALIIVDDLGIASVPGKVISASSWRCSMTVRSGCHAHYQPVPVKPVARSHCRSHRGRCHPGSLGP
jgi:DNA replication protein DnaC